MVFVPNRHKGGRSSPFGSIELPKPHLRGAVRDLLAEVRHQRCLADKSAMRVFPLKGLKNKLLKATSLEVTSHPVGCKASRYTDVRKDQKIPDGCKVVQNPLWDSAPKGAYYKSRRFASLANLIVRIGGNSKIARLIERLSINIWKMSRRDFDGLCRSIRTKLVQSLERDKILKKPEALERTRALTSTPQGNLCRKWYTSYQDTRYCSGCVVLRLSKKLENARLALRCTKCTGPTCVGKWLTPSQ